VFVVDCVIKQFTASHVALHKFTVFVYVFTAPAGVKGENMEQVGQAHLLQRSQLQYI
jgi:hypothetical protein